MNLFKKTFFIDENIRMSDNDIISLNENVVNSTDIFKKGTKDEVLTKYAKNNHYIIVTKDIRFALRSVIDGVNVIYINDDEKKISFLKVHSYNPSKYGRMFDYLQKRFGFVPSR